MIITLKRIAKTPRGVFGVLLKDDGDPFAVTGEREDLNNAQGISCIPVGAYNCERIHSPHFGEVWHIQDVPNRTHILMHKGNVPEEDSEGCILVGEEFGYLGGKTAVLSSGKGFREFMDYTIHVDHFVLTVLEV